MRSNLSNIYLFLFIYTIIYTGIMLNKVFILIELSIVNIVPIKM